MKYNVVFIGILLTLTGCKDIFTTSAFSSFKKDTTDMSASELSEYLSSTPLSQLSDDELQSAEDTLEESRVELTEKDMDDPEKVALYVEQTTQLMDINMEQADVEGLLSDLTASDEESGDSLTSLLEDEERIDNIQAASDYAVDAYKADPSSLNSSELVVGSVGLVSDIVSDDAKSAALDSVEDYETETLQDAGFTDEEIGNIQTAQEMLDLAQEGMSEDMANMFSGVSF